MDNIKIQEARDKFVAIITEQYPTLDIRKGTAINDLMINFAALGYAMICEDLLTLEDKLFLKDIIADPTNIDSNMLDGIISNFFITRTPGSKTTGVVKLVFNQSRDYYIPLGSLFSLTSQGYTYTTTVEYDLTSDDLFYDEYNEEYYTFINVEASEIGPDYVLEEGTALAPGVLTGYIETATVYQDFSSGSNAETDAVLLGRIKNNLSNRGMFSRQSIETTLREKFTDIHQITSIGYNDREMQRDVNTAGVKTGGKVDIYVRQPVQGHLQGIIEISSDADGVVIVPDAYKPILRVKNIATKKNPAELFTNFTMVNSGSVLDRFSTREKLEITVPANLVATPLLISVDYAPGIREIQEFVDDDENGYLRSDSMVKTYMPCFVTIGINYRPEILSSSLTTDQLIISKLIEYINNYDSDVLYASKIINVLHSINITNIELPIFLSGVFYLPDGTTEEISDPNYLSVEENVRLGVSPRTYRFFISTSDITVTAIS